MKTIKIMLSMVITIMLVSSCDSFLDTTPEDLRSPDQIFESQSSTERALMGVYSFLRKDYPFSTSATYSSSDIVTPYTNQQTFNDGVWDASAAQYDRWYDYYKGIREATYFIQNIDKCPQNELSYDLREQWRAEARGVRAILYVNLMRMYGPVILLKDELVYFTSPELARPRSSWDECVDWVSSELKSLSENEFLPLQQTGEYYARLSKSILLAYRSRLLLISASDQFNGNLMYAGVRNKNNKPLFPSVKDNEKWELARQAAKDVIELGIFDLVKVVENGTINPYKSYQAIFTQPTTKEMIFPYMEDNSYLDKRLAPNSINGWGFGFSPTQEMIDMYAMKSGKYPIIGYQGGSRLQPKIDETTGYKEDGFSQFTNPLERVERKTFNMYVDREPRFYASILYGGLSWFVTNKTADKIFVEMYWNGNNGRGASHNYSPSGYALVKFVMPDYIASQRNVKREIPIIRYPEILLNYIEATIEAGKSDASLLNDVQMFKSWDAIRERAGVPSILNVYPEAKGNANELMKLLRKERQIEFAFEGMSFFDNRRWMIAKEKESGYFHGMDVTARGTTGATDYPDSYFKRVTIFDRKPRVFYQSFYLFPIPQSVLNKNHELVQNYNW